jgi:hypothetical protein
LPPTRPAIYHVASAAPTAPGTRTVQTARLLPGTVPTPNDIINLRGFWEGFPPIEPAPEPTRAATILRPPADIPSAEPASTASVGAITTAAHADRTAPDLALAYAAAPEREARPRAAPVAAAMTRMPIATIPDTTIAIKRSGNRPSVLSAPAPALAVKPGDRHDDPWMRAMIWAPSARDFMTTSQFTAPDFRQLQPMMHKPPSSVMMTFSADPHLGLVAERFSGSAIVFMSTVTFGLRTAALR